jgi:hypothetical protein
MALRTPAQRIPSHGTNFLGQRFAYDFVRLDGTGSRFAKSSALRHFCSYAPAAHFFAWDEPVFAAFAGTVVASEDGWSDRVRVNAIWELIRASCFLRPPKPNDLRSLLGNYVLVEGQPGVALFAHLRKGSIRVRRGQAVKAGEQLANVGNSGNSTMPHLHFHVMDSVDPWKAQGVYCGFQRGQAGAEPFVPLLLTTFRAQPLVPSDP